MSRNTTADQCPGDGGLRSANAGAEAVDVMAYRGWMRGVRGTRAGQPHIAGWARYGCGNRRFLAARPSLQRAPWMPRHPEQGVDS